MADPPLELAPESCLTFATGVAVSWHEPGYPSFEQDVPQAFATREIKSVPDVGELSGALGVPTWQVMRAAAGSMLSTAAFMPGCEALELRYVAGPEHGHTRIRMFITAKARTWNVEVARMAVEVACASLPKGFQRDTASNPPVFGGSGFGQQILELRRHEEVTLPQWQYIPADFYYTINDDPGDGSGWPAFWEVLSRANSEVIVSILFKGTDLHPVERNVIASITTDLNVLGTERMDYDAFGNQVFVPACVNARIARDSWLQRRSQLQRPLLSRIAVLGDLQQTLPVASALASALSAGVTPGVTHPMYVELTRTESDYRQAKFSFDWLEILPWGGHEIWEEDTAPVSLRRMPYLFGINEAASLAILPVPDEQGAPGFARSRRADVRRASIGYEDDDQSITIGGTLHRGESTREAKLPLSAIVRHTLIVGSPGSGKTTTVMTILTELWRRFRIPFLVIEPAKREYRSLLETPGLDDLQVFCLGREDISPLRLNPLLPPGGVRREVHASSVMATLKLAMPMFAPLPQLFVAAIDSAYEQAGWEEDTTTEDGLIPPALRDLQRCFEDEFGRRDYRGDALNIGSAGKVRLESLMHGSQGRLLDTIESSNFDDLLQRPVLIELDEVADPEDKAVVAALILDRVRAAARARGSTGGHLRHVTVIEEAHRLLSKIDGGRERADGDDARAQAVRAFCEAIAELRAQGEGFLLSSQFPAQLAAAAVAAAGTRILHRLETAADRQVVLDDIGANEIDRHAATRLRQGEAIIRWPELDEAILIQVAAAEGVDSGRQTEDNVVAAKMQKVRLRNQSLLPYKLCTREICDRGCSPLVRNAGRSLARSQSDEARKLWEAAQPPASARFVIALRLLAAVEGDERRAYCTAVHLSLRGDAFTTKRAIDIRPDIIAAFRTRSCLDEE